MDFNSLGAGSPFYVIRKTDRARLLVGTIKEKTIPQPRYQASSVQQVVSITVTIDGHDEVFADLPINVEIAARGSDTFSGNREAILQAVDGMIQTSRKALEMVDWHKGIIEDGEHIVETLNPRYAEEKQRAKSIKELEHWKAETDQKLTELTTQNAEMLSILRSLNGSPKG